jgi:hypothetical protein
MVEAGVFANVIALAPENVSYTAERFVWSSFLSASISEDLKPV